MHRLDLNELLRRGQYQATIHDVVIKDTAAQRHMRLVLFHAILWPALAFIGACVAVHFGWLPATPDKQDWATRVIETTMLPLIPGAIGFGIAYLVGMRRDH